MMEHLLLMKEVHIQQRKQTIVQLTQLYLRFLKMGRGQVPQVLLIQMIQVCILWDGVSRCQMFLHSLELQILSMANSELIMGPVLQWKIGVWSTYNIQMTLALHQVSLKSTGKLMMVSLLVLGSMTQVKRMIS